MEKVIPGPQERIGNDPCGFCSAELYLRHKHHRATGMDMIEAENGIKTDKITGKIKTAPLGEYCFHIENSFFCKY